MADAKMIRHVLDNWDISGTLDDLKAQSWEKTEPHRIDRRVFVASGSQAAEAARKTVSKKEWKEATGGEIGFEHEIVEEYMEALGDVLARIMGSHVYVTQEDGDWFAGQYEDGDIEELRAEGYQIDD